MWKFYLFLLCSILFTSSSASSNITTDVIDFAHESCQKETLSGSTFTHFHNISELSQSSSDARRGELLVRFQGLSDGHVILTQNASDEDKIYMIVLGSYSNSRSEIRKSKWGESMVKMNTPQILSDQQFRGFWIKWKNGEIWVHSEGSEMPLLHWIDEKDPLPIRYFSFASYDNVIVQVAFNCKPIKHIIHHPSLTSEGGSPNPKRRLSMLKNYDRMALPNFKLNPKLNDSFVTVTLPSLTLTHFHIDEEKQTFELEAWPYFSWQDDRLSWQPENNEPGNGKMHFSADEIWLPDILLYNSAQPTNLNIYGKTQALVERDGKVSWVPSSKFVTYCDLNLRKWPKDIQQCTVKLGSWTHDSSEIDMQFGKIEGEDEKVKVLQDLKKEDMEWELVDRKAIRESRTYDCCPESYTSITYVFTLKRTSSLYTYTVFLPAILVSFVNLALFLQPAESTGRVTVAAVNFLVVSVYLIFFRTRLPGIDHVPYIVILYGWNLVLLALSILTAALVSNMNLLIGTSVPPRFLQPLYNPSFLAILCLKNVPASFDRMKSQIGGSMIKRTTEDGESNRDFCGETRTGKEWMLLSSVVDRVSFVVYATITFILLACFC